MAQTDVQFYPAIGLTPTKAPFIEVARNRGELHIEQPYDLYSEENHEAWRQLYARIQERWQRYDTDKFLEGISKLRLDPHRVPHLSNVNQFLAPLTGFKAKAVTDYVPAYIFFECLCNCEFPATITVHRLDSLKYLPEPDIFHDIAGHVPMHTDKRFADTLVHFGEAAHTAARIVQEIKDPNLQTQRIISITRALARFLWFTIEFGLMRGKNGELKVYGTGMGH